MLDIAEIVILVLATNQAVEIWRHSAIMAPLRLRVDVDVPPPLVPEKLHTNARNVLRCPFCLSFWVGGFVFVSWYLGRQLVAENPQTIRGAFAHLFGWTPLVFIMALGISRGANIINDLTWRFNRTPKANKIDLQSEE